VIVAQSDRRPFSYLTAPNAETYRQVMGVFVRAKRRFAVHLRPEDVHAALVGEMDQAAVAEALTSLEQWGNLRADPDTSRVTTVEDFHRARYLYQLTERGSAVEQAVAVYDEALGRRAALQAVALVDIATQLRGLAELAAQPDPDPAKVHLLLRGLVDRFTDLAGNAQAFMASLRRTIDLQDADVDAFAAYKDRLIDYLERFIKDLVGTGAEITGLVERIEGYGVATLLGLAARREAEDAAPGVGEGDDDPREQEFRRGLTRWAERWDGFRGWFVSEPQHPSQAKLLRAQARAAIPQLLQVVATLNERRGGRSDRSADFRILARWFAQAPGERELHQLWHTAFGLSAARHLTVDEHLLAASVPASTPWADGPALSISPRLRRTGSYERRGRPNRVIDRSAQRRYLAEKAAREALETDAARAALCTTHPTRLADLGELDPVAFRLFLALLGDALAARRPDTPTVQTTSSDGSLAIRLTAIGGSSSGGGNWAGGWEGIAEIRTPHGVFRGPDHLVEIVDLTGGSLGALGERSA
jgi:uncharacterized protein (TIGR02677 family)